jgi:hypothetical protein
VAGWSDCGLKNPVEYVLWQLSVALTVGHSTAIPQNLRLDAQEVGLDRCRPTDAPHERGKPQYELALDGGLRVIVEDDCSLESLIVLDVLQDLDDGLGA